VDHDRRRNLYRRARAGDLPKEDADRDQDDQELLQRD
jgi:hypothetical protein